MSRRAAVFRRPAVWHRRRLALVAQPVTATFAGDGAMTAGATRDTPTSVSLAGAGSMSATATTVRPAAAGFAGAGSMSAAASADRAAAVSFAGAGQMLTIPGVVAAASFAGAGAMTAAAQQDHGDASAFDGAGAMTVSAQSTQLVAATFAGAGAMTADARPVRPAAAALAGAGLMSTSGTRVRPAAVTMAGAGAFSASGTRIRPAAVALAGAGQLIASAKAIASNVLAPSFWAVTSSGLVPLPHFVKLAVSPVRNGVGSVEVEYPAWGKNAAVLRALADEDRDLEVEIWLAGRQSGALRGILSDSTGDDVAEDATNSYKGSLLDVLLDEALVWPQAAAEKQELIFSGKNAGEVAATVLGQAQVRGCLAGITRDFTTAVDSTGQPWALTVNIKFSPQATLLDVVSELVELGMLDGFELTAARVLRMYGPGRQGVDRTVGAPPAQTVFRRGRNISESPRRHTTSKSGTAVLVAGADGVYESASDPSALARRGRRIEVADSANNLNDAASAQSYAQNRLATVVVGELEVSHRLEFAPGFPRPGSSFDRGDWVWSDTRGTLTRLRVWQWTLAVDAGGMSGELVLNTARTDALLSIARKLKRISSGAAVVGTSQPPDVADTLAPAAPTGVTVDSSAYKDGADNFARLDVGWTPVTTNADMSAADDVAGYRVEWTESADATAWRLAVDVGSGTAGSASFGGVGAGVLVRVRVLAYDRNGNTSAPSSVVELLTEQDNTAPPTPAAPTVTTRVSILAADYNGRDNVGAAMPVDVREFEVHVSAASSFTPDRPLLADGRLDTAASTTFYDQLPPGGGVMPITGRAYGAATFVRIVAVDTANNASAASVQGSATPTQVVSADVFAGAVGTAQLASLAVTTAKIDNGAVNDLQVGNVSAGKITTGVLSALLTLSGLIRTDVSPNRRMEISGNGWASYTSGNVLFAELNVATETMLVTGKIRTGLPGVERIEALQDGTLRFYPPSGTDYASLNNNGGVLQMTSMADGSGRRAYGFYNPSGFTFAYGTSSVYRSRLDVGLTYAVMAAPVTGIRIYDNLAPADGTDNRFHLLAANASGDINGSVWHYYTRSDGTGILRGAPHGAAIGFYGGYTICLSGSDTAYGGLTADGFTTPSSEVMKSRPQELRRALGTTGIGVVRKVDSTVWAYLHDLEERPEYPGGMRQRILEDGTTVQVPIEWASPPGPPPLHVGPIAEHLEAVSPHLVRRDWMGRLMTDQRDLLGVLWAAVRELDAEVTELRGRFSHPARRPDPPIVDGEVA